MKEVITTGIIILFTGGGLVGTVFYLKGVVAGMKDEVIRQNGTDRDLFAKVNQKVDKADYARDQDRMDKRFDSIDDGITTITQHFMER